MHYDKNTAGLSPEGCRQELCSILARGILRLHHRRILIGKIAKTSPPKTPLNSAAEDLEVPLETVLSVTTG